VGAVEALLSLVAPPVCAVCAAPCRDPAVLCGRCEARVASLRPVSGVAPRSIGGVWSAAPHDGIARELVGALKFRGLLPVAALLAERIAAGAPRPLLEGVLVPVPAAPSRRRRRGFDPAALIAGALGRLVELQVSPCLRRANGPRQVGRPRARRLADPPRIQHAGPAPGRAVLVDDVMTTGGTLSACAKALTAAGADEVVALTFARTP
jgi:predicted amidophosphoribosyltransferase